MKKLILVFCFSFLTSLSSAAADDRYNGSDHRPVISTSSVVLTEQFETYEERLRRLISEVRARLIEIENLASGLER